MQPIFDIPNLRPLGRFHRDSAVSAGALPLLWAGSGLDLLFTGPALSLFLEADFESAAPWLAAELNGAPILRMPLNRGLQEVCLFQGMTPGIPKRVRIFKETQPIAFDPAHRLWVRGLGWEAGGFLPLPEPACRLEFIGDSLTSGEGLVGAAAETDWTTALFSASRCWASLAAGFLDADFRLISQSGWGVRSGWDNDPSRVIPRIYETVCALRRGPANASMGAQQPYDFNSWRPDAVVVNLGSNDAEAMVHDPWQGPEGQCFRQTGDEAGLRLFEDAAIAFLRQLRRRNPSAALVWTHGMADAPLGPVLAQAVRRFREETGDQNAYDLPLPAATEATMGSRQHPGPLCHQAAAQKTAEFLKTILTNL